VAKTSPRRGVPVLSRPCPPQPRSLADAKVHRVESTQSVEGFLDVRNVRPTPLLRGRDEPVCPRYPLGFGHQRGLERPPRKKEPPLPPGFGMVAGTGRRGSFFADEKNPFFAHPPGGGARSARVPEITPATIKSMIMGRDE
jgi:hypothetical protein